MFENMISCSNRKDVGEVVSNTEATGAADVQVNWEDLGMTFCGRDEVASMRTNMFRSVPDLNMSLSEVVVRGPADVEATMTWSGTQVGTFHPMFPCGKSVQWLVVLRVAFGSDRKIKQASVRWIPPRPLLLQPSQLAGLSQGALLLARTPGGSRLLQAGLEATASDAKVMILSQLRGHVASISACPHGNHVLQKYIVSMPPRYAQFIIDELRGRVAATAQHVAASRVLERLLEHCPSEQAEVLVEELLEDAVGLCRHPFGNFVLQRLFEHGSPQQRGRLAERLRPFAGQLARHRQGSNVVRCALAYCEDEDRQCLADALCPDPQSFASLARHAAGSFVARTLKKQRLRVGQPSAPGCSETSISPCHVDGFAPAADDQSWANSL